jgi:2,4-diketo-3-deoxy-L-fuconate hydrolase
MQICRYGNGRLGLAEGDDILDVTDAAMSRLPSLRWPLPSGDAMIGQLSELLPVLGGRQTAPHEGL